MNSFNNYILRWQPLMNVPSYKVRYNLTLTFVKSNKGQRVKQFALVTDFSSFKLRKGNGMPPEWEAEAAKYV